MTSIAADLHGRVYVADRIGSTIRVYGSDGIFLKTIGRQGSGPGEFQWPADVTFAENGRLYVRDAVRITVYTPGSTGGIADSLIQTWNLGGAGNLESRRSRIDHLGRYLYPGYQFRDGSLPRHFYVVYKEGQAGDTIGVPAYPGLEATRSARTVVGRRLLPGLSHVPFAPVPVWDATPAGTILSSSGGLYHLIETNVAGDTVRRIEGHDRAVRAVQPRERMDSLAALRRRLDSLPVPPSGILGMPAAVARLELPESRPAVIGVHVALDGTIWVERWPESTAFARVYDVLSADGLLLGIVASHEPLLRDPPPWFSSTAIWGVVHDSATDVQRVVKMQLTRGLGRR